MRLTSSAMKAAVERARQADKLFHIVDKYLPLTGGRDSGLCGAFS